MSWTTNKPTQDGYYWAKQARIDDKVVLCMVLVQHNGTLTDSFETGNGLPLGWYSHWMGPLTPPEPPTP